MTDKWHAKSLIKIDEIQDHSVVDDLNVVSRSYFVPPWISEVTPDHVRAKVALHQPHGGLVERGRGVGWPWQQNKNKSNNHQNDLKWGFLSLAGFNLCFRWDQVMGWWTWSHPAHLRRLDFLWKSTSGVWTAWVSMNLMIFSYNAPQMNQFWFPIQARLAECCYSDNFPPISGTEVRQAILVHFG